MSTYVIYIFFYTPVYVYRPSVHSLNPLPLHRMPSAKDKNYTKLSTWPLQDRKVKLELSDLKDEQMLFETMNELNGFNVGIEDFLSLNGDVSVYGWQHVVNFAVFEKYNFLLPLMKMSLAKEHYEQLLGSETRGLKDFVYVYCTMLTLILQKQNPYRRKFGLYEKIIQDALKPSALSDILDEAIKEVDTKKRWTISRNGAKASAAAKPTAAPTAAAKPTPAPTAAAKPTAATFNKKNFKVKPAIADGNCLFDAILISLHENGQTDSWEPTFRRRFKKIYKNKNSKKRAQNFRKILATYLESSENTFENKESMNSIEGNGEQLRTSHAEHLTTVEYGNEIDIKLIANYFDICVVVFSAINDSYSLISENGIDTVSLESGLIEKSNKEFCEKRHKAYILFNGMHDAAGHFDAMIKTKGTKVEVEMETL